MNSEQHTHGATAHKLARLALFSFLMTFILSRTFVFLIMSKMMPNMYFFMHGTHVHHLNYGIFLLSAVGGYSVFRRPVGRAAEITALLYGVGMGLTFDEFGMWLHLGGSYWQRASVDAVIVVSALFGLVAFARTLKRFESHHFWLFLALLVAVLGFGVVLYTAGKATLKTSARSCCCVAGPSGRRASKRALKVLGMVGACRNLLSIVGLITVTSDDMVVYKCSS